MSSLSSSLFGLVRPPAGATTTAPPSVTSLHEATAQAPSPTGGGRMAVSPPTHESSAAHTPDVGTGPSFGTHTTGTSSPTLDPFNHTDAFDEYHRGLTNSAALAAAGGIGRANTPLMGTELAINHSPASPLGGGGGMSTRPSADDCCSCISPATVAASVRRGRGFPSVEGLMLSSNSNSVTHTPARGTVPASGVSPRADVSYVSDISGLVSRSTPPTSLLTPPNPSLTPLVTLANNVPPATASWWVNASSHTTGSSSPTTVVGAGAPIVGNNGSTTPPTQLINGGGANRRDIGLPPPGTPPTSVVPSPTMLAGNMSGASNRRHVRESSGVEQGSTREWGGGGGYRGDQSCCDVVAEEIKTLRWRMLPIICFLTFGIYYTMDFPAAIGTGEGNTIQTRFAAKGHNYNQAMNQALYSVYSYPNTVLAIFGGLLIDKYIGLRKSMLLFSMLVTMGSLFFWLAVQMTNFPMLLFSRFLFGLGGECLFVAKSAFVARWFRGGRGMALAFGITISFSRVGSSFNFLLSPMMADAYGVQMACVAGVAACLLSLIACIILIMADIYAVKVGIIKAEAVGNEEGGEVMQLKDLLKLPLELWLICVICIFCYCAIFPFIGIAKNFFEVKFDVTGTAASRWISFYQFTAAGFSPVVGFLVDQSGKYPQWLMFASCCFILLHAVLLLTNSLTASIAVMPLMGLAYSFLVSGLWPCVPFAVPSSMCGMAYGIITAVQNFGLATLPLIAGKVLDDYTPRPTADDKTPLPTLRGFELTLYLFMASAMIALVTSFVLMVMDQQSASVVLRENPLLAVGDGELGGGRNQANTATATSAIGILSASPSIRDALLKARDGGAKLLGDTMSRDGSPTLSPTSSGDDMARTVAIYGCEYANNLSPRHQTDSPIASRHTLSQHDGDKCTRAIRGAGTALVVVLGKPKVLAVLCILLFLVNAFPRMQVQSVQQMPAKASQPPAIPHM